MRISTIFAVLVKCHSTQDTSFSNRWHMKTSWIAAFLMGFLTFTLHGAATAAEVPAGLVKQAAREGLVRVLVNLNVSVSLEDIASKRKAAEIATRESNLHSRLGSSSRMSAAWSNGSGQVSLLVDPDGLARLASDPQVQAIHPDTV